MSSIKIEVEGQELESITIELTQEEVKALYQLRKEQSTKIAELQKELESSKSSEKSAKEARDTYNSELTQANALLTALGVAEQTNEEQTYYRKNLQVATRIALYIAQSK